MSCSVTLCYAQSEPYSVLSHVLCVRARVAAARARRWASWSASPQRRPAGGARAGCACHAKRARNVLPGSRTDENRCGTLMTQEPAQGEMLARPFGWGPIFAVVDPEKENASVEFSKSSQQINTKLRPPLSPGVPPPPEHRCAEAGGGCCEICARRWCYWPRRRMCTRCRSAGDDRKFPARFALE